MDNDELQSEITELTAAFKDIATNLSAFNKKCEESILECIKAATEELK